MAFVLTQTINIDHTYHAHLREWPGLALINLCTMYIRTA